MAKQYQFGHLQLEVECPTLDMCRDVLVLVVRIAIVC